MINGKIYDRFLYCYELNVTLPEVQSVYGTGEVERTGEHVRTTKFWNVIATSPEYAHFALMENYGSKYWRRDNYDVEVLHCEIIPIDAEITKMVYK